LSNAPLKPPPTGPARSTARGGDFLARVDPADRGLVGVHGDEVVVADARALGVGRPVLGERSRLDRSGTDRVARDVLAAVLERDRLGEAVDRVLGRDVVRDVGLAAELALD